MRVPVSRFIASSLFVLLIASGGVSAVQDSSTQAQQAAETWLSLIDGASYAESWTSAAEYFRNQVPESSWRDSMQGVRAPLGQLGSRSLAMTTAATSLPGAPDGEYRVFQFETSFEHKQTAVETVTAVLEADGAWRITGYFIR